MRYTSWSNRIKDGDEWLNINFENTSDAILTVNLLNKQDELIQEKDKEISRFKKDTYNWYWKSKEKDKEIEKLKKEKEYLIETIDFCKDLLYHTNNSKRMKQLRKTFRWISDE